MKSIIKRAFIKTAPVLTGYLAIGIGFGLLAVSKDIGVLFAFLTSTFVYAGSLQFAATIFLSEKVSLLTVALVRNTEAQVKDVDIKLLQNTLKNDGVNL